MVYTRLFKRVPENQMKGNTDKYHLLMSKEKSSEIHIGEFIIKIDSKLYF